MHNKYLFIPRKDRKNEKTKVEVQRTFRNVFDVPTASIATPKT